MVTTGATEIPEPSKTSKTSKISNVSFPLLGALALGGALVGGERLLSASAEGRGFEISESQSYVGVRARPPQTPLEWRGELWPGGEFERVELRLDDRSVALVREDEGEGLDGAKANERGQPALARLGTPAAGVHILEFALNRRGERRERIVESLFVGEFLPRSELQARCVAHLSASTRALELALRPVVERELLPRLRRESLLGPRTRVSTFGLEPRRGQLGVVLVVEGAHRIEVAARFELERADGRRLRLRLAALDRADFEGSARNLAGAAGAGAGAWLGGPIGAVVGYLVVDAFVDSQARDEIRKQIEGGLAALESIELLPERLPLLEGPPPLTVQPRFCADPKVDATGLHASFSLAPEIFGEVAAAWPLPGPLVGSPLAEPTPLGEGEALRAEISYDLPNALLESWASTGQLSEWLERDAALSAVNRQLEPWTPLRVDGVAPSLPPVLMGQGEAASATGGRPDAPTVAAALVWPGLNLQLSRTDGVEVLGGETLELGARARVELHWDPVHGRLRVGGALDDLWVGCRREAAGRMLRRACFSALADAAELPRRVDEALQATLDALPSFELGRILREGLALPIDALAFSTTPAKTLRVSAGLEP